VRGRSSYTPERAERFLELLAGGGSVTKAAEAIGRHRRTVYDWKARHEDFAQAWDEAVEAGTDLIEDEATRRAVHGVDRPEFFQGRLVGSVREYSDQLIMTLLKARRRWKYSDKIEQRSTETVRVIECTSFAGAPPEE
jgi:hypothetical protein